MFDEKYSNLSNEILCAKGFCKDLDIKYKKQTLGVVLRNELDIGNYPYNLTRKINNHNSIRRFGLHTWLMAKVTQATKVSSVVTA